MRDKIIGKIYQTDNYDQFKYIDGNRNLVIGTLKSLRNEIKAPEDIRPIEVDTQYGVIDGQHRLEIAREKGFPISYYHTLKPNANISTVQIVNSIGKRWTVDDYIESYIKSGKNEYKTYKDFKKSYGFSHQICIQLLTGLDGSDNFKAFQQGKFKIKDIEKAAKTGETLSLIGQYYDGAGRRAFVGAILKCLKNKNFIPEVFVSKLAKQPSKMRDCVRPDDYLVLIEDIYNYHSREKVVLR